MNEGVERPASASSTGTADEARAAREMLGLSVEQLAPELGLTPPVVEAWEAGRIRVPRRIMAELRWRAAVFERTRALDESGLPVCPWVARWHAESGSSARERRARLELLMTHTRSCPTCEARERYLAERFPPLPPRPVPGWMGAIAWFDARIKRLPRWLRPVATGALVFAGYSLVRMVLLVPRLGGGAHSAVSAAEGLFASAAIGGVVGLLYSGFRGVRERRAPGPPA